ncbi:MAG: hypothetical protein AB9915_03775 [Candidatus Dojkabacteria bacterium]
MYQDIFEKINSVVSHISPVFLSLFILLLGMYKFWKECNVTRKENTSVFDMFFFSSLFGLFLGRFTFILSSWEKFEQYIWYWLPYEKYGDQMFFFRLLPWRFFRIWDWEIQIIVMFVGFTMLATLWTFFVKRWKWSHLYTPIFTSSILMISSSFLLIGLYADKYEWFVQGSVMLVPLIILVFLQKIIRDRIIGKKEIRVLAITEIVFLLMPILYMGYSYMGAEITSAERLSVIVLIIWFILGSFIYLAEINKANVTIEKVSSLGTISESDIEKSIRLSK